jgi:hypothetical protein
MTLGAPCRSSPRFQDVLVVLSAAHPKTVSSPPLIRRVSKSVSDDSLAYSMSTHCRDYDSPPQRRCSFQLEAACIDPKVMISLTNDIVESTGDMNQSTSWSECTVRIPRIATSSTMNCDEDTLATFTTLYNPASNEMKLLDGDGDGHQGNDVEWMPPPPRVERFQNSLRLLLGNGNGIKYDEEAVMGRSRTWSQRPAAAGSRKMAGYAASWRPKSDVGTGTAEDVQWTPPRDNSIDLGLSTSEKHDQWNASLDGADPMTIVTMESNGTLLTSSGTFSGTNETNVFTTAGTTIAVSAGLLDGPNGESMEASLNDDFMQVQEAARNHSLGGSNEHNGGHGLETAPQRRRRPVRVLENVASGAKVIHMEKCRVRRWQRESCAIMAAAARVEL